MEKYKQLLQFHALRWLKSAYCLALLCLFIVLLNPVHPFRGDNGHRVELPNFSSDKQDYELFRIYSIVKSRRVDLKDASAWAISETILTESLKHSLDPLLVLAVIEVESSFQHTAVSRRGARGLMQIRPFVANSIADQVDLGVSFASRELHPEALDDPILNIKLGAFYLQHLKRRFRDVKLALTAYNWGPTEIRSRLDMEQAVPLDYAMKVLSAYQSYRRLDRHPNKRTP
jgi:soluble lytic murein transglycosylase